MTEPLTLPIAGVIPVRPVRDIVSVVRSLDIGSC